MFSNIYASVYAYKHVIKMMKRGRELEGEWGEVFGTNWEERVGVIKLQAQNKKKKKL